MAFRYFIPFTNSEGVAYEAMIEDTIASVVSLFTTAVAYPTTHSGNDDVVFDPGYTSGTSYDPSLMYNSFQFLGTVTSNLFIHLQLQIITTGPVTFTLYNNATVLDTFTINDFQVYTKTQLLTIQPGDSITLNASGDFTFQFCTMKLNTSEQVTDAVIDGEANAVTTSIVDNDENKYTPIRARECVVRFLSTQQHNLNSFLKGQGDEQFRVSFYRKSDHYFIFMGYLVLSDISQVFMDDFNRDVVELTATDGIALLKAVPWTDFNGQVPRTKTEIIKVIAQCLQKTGLNLSINVMCNLMEEHLHLLNQPAFNNIFIEPKTFEDEINSRIDCYDVLAQILSAFGCYLTQWNAQWWIRRIDEYDNNPNYYDSYNYLGVYSGTAQNVSITKTIGKNLPIKFITAPAIVKADRPHSLVKEEYEHNLPKEIIDNVDFSRGNLINDLGDEKQYALDDWTSWKGSLLNLQPGDDQPYIKRIFQDGYEKERYVVGHGIAQRHYARPNPIEMHFNDKVSISIDWRTTVDTTGDKEMIHDMRVIFVTDTNQVYIYGGTPSIGSSVAVPIKWRPLSTNADFQSLYMQWNANDVNEKDWQTLSGDIDPVPANGNLYLYFPFSSPEIHYTNLRFDYKPYINGSYQKYKGQYNKVSQSGQYKAKNESQVYLSDSPKKLFKGALWKQDSNGKFVLAGRWLNGADPTIRNMNPQIPDYLMPLGKINAFDKWNQYRRVMRIIDGTLDGLDSNGIPPDLMHTFFLTDNSPHTNNKYFMLLHYEIDWRHCTWNGYFAEVFDSTIGKIYTDSFEFKYIENR